MTACDDAAIRGADGDVMPTQPASMLVHPLPLDPQTDVARWSRFLSGDPTGRDLAIVRAELDLLGSEPAGRPWPAVADVLRLVAIGVAQGQLTHEMIGDAVATCAWSWREGPDGHAVALAEAVHALPNAPVTWARTLLSRTPDPARAAWHVLRARYAGRAHWEDALLSAAVGDPRELLVTGTTRFAVWRASVLGILAGLPVMREDPSLAMRLERAIFHGVGEPCALVPWCVHAPPGEFVTRLRRLVVEAPEAAAHALRAAEAGQLRELAASDLVLLDAQLTSEALRAVVAGVRAAIGG